MFEKPDSGYYVRAFNQSDWISYDGAKLVGAARGEREKSSGFQPDQLKGAESSLVSQGHHPWLKKVLKKVSLELTT